MKIIRNIIIFIIVCIGIGFVTFLLMENKIDSSAFTWLFLGLIISGIILYGFDRFRELNFKDLKIILDETKEVRDETKEVRKDIYAKAEMVKKLGEEIAELTAFTVARVGRFAPKDLTERILEARDKISKVLKEIGSNESKVKEICEQLDNMILHDLKTEVYRKVQEITYEIVRSGKNINCEEIHKNVKKVLFENYDRDILISYLKEKDIDREGLDPLLDKVDKFIEEKKLFK